MPSYKLLYQDEHVIAVSKGPDVLSVPGRGEHKQDCLWRRVQVEFPTARIVHRLDYATSGVMILALDAEAHRRLNRAFQERKTHKVYQAIVHPALSGDEGTVDLPLRCDWENRPLQIVDHEQGKQAQTHWRRMEETELGTRVELTPITGRSHQLRVHMQSLSCPIIGDRFYATESQQALSERLLLHARLLELAHPMTGEALKFEDPCPF